MPAWSGTPVSVACSQAYFVSPSAGVTRVERPGLFLSAERARAPGRAKVLASALKAAGIGAGEKVGIYASNCPEWMMCILAANRSSVSVGAAPHLPHSHSLACCRRTMLQAHSAAGAQARKWPPTPCWCMRSLGAALWLCSKKSCLLAASTCNSSFRDAQHGERHAHVQSPAAGSR